LQRTRRGDRPTLLIVDDDAGIRDALHVILDDDYAVLDAADGESAMKIAQSCRVNLILLDILLPDVDGIEMLQELRTIAPRVPIIVLTAVKTVRTAVTSMKLGAVDYLTKPFREEELLASLHQTLDRAAQCPTSGDVPQAEGDEPRPRPKRILIVEGSVGWRATLAVALERVGRVATVGIVVAALSEAMSFQPTCVVLDAQRSPSEAVRFLGGLHTRLTTCPVLVITDDPHLQGRSIWEALNIRGVVHPPADVGPLISRIRDVVDPFAQSGGVWPRPGVFVSRVVGYLSMHFGEDLSVDDLARVAGISGSHLAHVFRAETGMPIRSYLTKVRVEIATDLVMHTDENLADIAAASGFFDASHLSRVFLDVRGKRPSEYRRQSR
jgi:DNA-binding response OmpR family regulator